MTQIRDLTRICPRCKGKGDVTYDMAFGGQGDYRCVRCRGTGRILAERRQP